MQDIHGNAMSGGERDTSETARLGGMCWEYFMLLGFQKSGSAKLDQILITTAQASGHGREISEEIGSKLRSDAFRCIFRNILFLSSGIPKQESSHGKVWDSRNPNFT